jgi:methylmalonyl-CoA mutase C-terminal domain/subunit
VGNELAARAIGGLCLVTPKVLLIRDDELHTRGYYVVAQALREAGMEVVLGGVQTPSEAATTAAQEDVDLIGYHIMTGAPAILLEMLFQKMGDAGVKVPVVVGGTLAAEEIPRLKALGVAEVFLPGATVEDLVERTRLLAPVGRYPRMEDR